MRKLLYNLIIGLALVAIIIVGFFLVMYYFQYQNKTCMADPFSYSILKAEEIYGDKAHGTISFLNFPDVISFNSNGIIKKEEYIYNFTIEK